MLDEYVVLFTSARIDRKTVPENLFCYDARHDDDCQGIACEIKPYVAVNHWGTILTVKRHITAEPDIRLNLTIFLCFHQIISDHFAILSHYP